MSGRLIVSCEFTWPVSDAAIDHYVEKLKEMRRQAEGGERPGLRRAETALAVIPEIVRGLGGWAAQELGMKPTGEEYARMTVNEKRALIASSLDSGMPIVQPEACAELVDALELLNAGLHAPLLQPDVRRRGKAPDLSAKAELGILKLIRWRHGRGQTVREAEEEIAAVVGCGRETIRDWRDGLEEVFGKEFVRTELELAEQVGRLEAQGKTLGDLRPKESDGDRLLEKAWMLERDPAVLADMRRRGIEKRHVQEASDSQGD